MSLARRLNDNKADYKSIRELFSNVQYFIPDYQRTYSWTNMQLGDLFESIISLCESNVQQRNDNQLQNYLGPILLKPHDASTDKFDILDGQQRLTTFSLIIYTIERMISEELSNDSFGVYSGKEDTINRLTSDLRSCLEYTQPFKLEKTTELTLVHSETKDKANYHDLLFKNSPKHLNNRIAINFREIKQRLVDMLDLKFFSSSLNKIEKLNFVGSMCLHNTYMLRTELKDVESAFAIFESLNTTGLQLTPFDLINGYMIENLKDQQTKVEWKMKVSDYRSNADIKLDEYVFYWINSKGESIDKISLFREVKSYINKNGAEKTAGEIIGVFDDLYEYLSSDEYVPVFLSLFKRKKIIPLYILLKNKGYSVIQIDEIMKNIIKYSVIELNLLGKSPGTFQYKIKQILDYVKGSQTCLTYNAIVSNIREVKSDYEGYSNTVDIFASLRSGMVRDQNVNKGLLLMIFEKLNGNLKPKFKTIDIEHVFPQNPDEEWYTYSQWQGLRDNDDDRERFTFYLGNSILLDNKLNRSIKNKYISHKKSQIENAMHEDSYLRIAIWNLIDFENFSQEAIMNRTNKLIDIMKASRILY